jgi:glucosyl-dolichyl phosphate glucuronosyltransferase
VNITQSITLSIAVYTIDRFIFIEKILELYLNLGIEIFDEFIIVVDNNEVLFKKLEKSIPRSKTRILKNEGNGLSDARNTALDHQKSSHICYLDDDAIPSKLWFEAMKNYKNGNRFPDLLTGRIIPFYTRNQSEPIPEDLRWLYGCTFPPIFDKDLSHKVRNPIGANMIINTELLNMVGGFGKKFGRNRKSLMTGDETDLALRLKKYNVETSYNHRLIVHHAVPPYRTGIKYLMKRSYYEGLSKAKMTSLKTSSKSEDLYLIYILQKIILEIHRIDFTIQRIICLIAVSSGYIKGKIDKYFK